MGFGVHFSLFYDKFLGTTDLLLSAILLYNTTYEENRERVLDA